MRFYKIFLIALCGTLAACGSKNKDEETTAAIPAPNSSAEVAPKPEDLLGTWSQTCQSATTFSQKSSIVLSGQQAEIQNAAYYGTADCSGTPTVAARYVVGYALGPLLAGVNDLDLVTVAVKISYGTPEAVTSANARAYCGFTNWQLNVEKDITGLRCETHNEDAAGSRHYTVFRLQTGKLFLGRPDAVHDGSTPALRPTDLDPSPYAH